MTMLTRIRKYVAIGLIGLAAAAAALALYYGRRAHYADDRAADAKRRAESSETVLALYRRIYNGLINQWQDHSEQRRNDETAMDRGDRDHLDNRW